MVSDVKTSIGEIVCPGVSKLARMIEENRFQQDPLYVYLKIIRKIFMNINRSA